MAPTPLRNLRVTDDDWDRWRVCAAALHRTVTDLISIATDAYLEDTMRSTDITATLDRPDDEYASGYDWAEDATARWLDAARAAGLDVEEDSVEVEHPNVQAGLVVCGEARYVLVVGADDRVRAEELPS